jgi:leucyl-tRNA synthetase
MHSKLVLYWMRVAALLVTPVAPHFAEHIHSTILKSPTSIQLALWPTPAEPVDRSVLEAASYMRGTIKTIRDAEVSLMKLMNKGKGKKGGAPSFDPKQAKSVRIYVATTFPDWQNICVQIVKEAYAEDADKVDDAKVKELLVERGLIKDKRIMPFIQAFKVR